MKKHLVAISMAIGLVVGAVPASAIPNGLHQASLPKGYVKTAPVIKPVNKNLKVGKSCADANYFWSVVGYLANGEVGYIKCDQGRKKYVADKNMPAIFQATLQPMIKTTVSKKSTFAMSPQLYIYPTIPKSQPKTPLSDAADFSNVEPCKLEELDSKGRPHMASGFPMPTERAVLDEKLVVQVVPVDFSDLRTSSKPATDLKDALDSLEKFWERQSTNKVDIQIRIPAKYLQLPKKVGDYKLSSKFPNFDATSYSNYVKAVAELSDPQIDFSEADVVILAHTPRASAKQIGTFIAEAGMKGSPFTFSTDEKNILNVMIQGGDEPRDIQNWTHEFGHMLGVTDSGNQGNMGFDLMLWYGNPELTAWNRFVLGILENEQINCVTEQASSTHWLRPVAWPGNNLESVVIPTGPGKAIVMESRRRTGYDVLLGKESEGLLVYTVDTSKSGAWDSGPFNVLGPKRMTRIGSWSLDAPLKKGESVSVDGWKITNVESGAFGDVVKVEKAS